MSSIWPMISIALSGITFGTIGYFGTQLLAEGFSGAQMLFWRFALASFFLVPFLFKIKLTQIPMKSLMICLSLGFTVYSVGTYCFFLAIPHIGSGIAMVVFYLFPLLVALMNWVIDKGKLSRLEILALILIIPGIFLLSFTNNVKFNVLGLLLGLGSAFLYGIYFYTSQKIGRKLPPFLASFMVCSGNAFFFLLITILEKNFYPPQSFSIWMLCIGFALIGTVLPLCLLFLGLRKTNITKAALISVLEPISTVLIGIWVLEETLSGHQALGMLIILLAALIVQFTPAYKPATLQ